MDVENSSKSIKIQIYPYIDNIHSAYRSLISNPPEGYTFVGNTASAKRNFIDHFKKSKVMRRFYRIFLKMSGTTKILDLVNKEKEIDEAQIVYSFGTFYKGDKPFILDMLDVPYSLSGNDPELFKKNKLAIEEYLSKNNCIKIICPHESLFNFMKKNFPRKISKKLVLIRQALSPVPYIENKNKFNKNKKIRLLFMGSINNPQDFYPKGGLEAIRAFEKISKEYKVELVLRCKIPEEIKKMIFGSKNIICIEEKISFEELINIYTSSDILLMPYHYYMLMATLEAMYFGIPPIVLDTYAAKDFVKNNYNGFIIKPSDKIKDYSAENYPAVTRTKKFIDQLWNFDEALINRIVNKLRLLIENPILRKKMSENAKKTIKDKFSIEIRNKKLKRILDEILKIKVK
jgi:glycosyltransferase involved in cell wall biosynthesis